nr:PREDICTED: uncharacterized protein LOC107767581 isoform X5 [Nicotiana tabacum]XP_016442114.1 PREDICTED: uncharacterized protein LOC107767581 isoform X5 [Nicotiana tabacum]
MQHWIVDAIDSEENRKRLKVKVRDVLNLSGEECIVLEFDYLDEPFGEAQGLIAGFCGILATDCALFPIHFEKWPYLPISYFDHVFDRIVKKRFCFKTVESVARRYVYNSIWKKWSANRLNLWRAFYDPLKSKAQIMENIPTGIPRDQWTSFVDYRFKETTLMAETGRAQLYLDTHKKQDGTYVNEAAKEICEKIELVLSQSTVDESEVSPNDVVGEVLGKEHSGRVRCLGLGAVPSKVFKHARPRFGGMNASSSDASCLNHCQENYNKLLNAHNQSQENYKQMMNAFKAYMIMKEGTIPEQFAEFFASPPTTPRDAASGSLSPTAQEDHLMAIIQVKTIEVFYN